MRSLEGRRLAYGKQVTASYVDPIGTGADFCDWSWSCNTIGSETTCKGGLVRSGDAETLPAVLKDYGLC